MNEEKYYGIRIGRPRSHCPYLMTVDNGETPMLFPTSVEAEKERLRKQPPCSKVVRVRVLFGRKEQA